MIAVGLVGLLAATCANAMTIARDGKAGTTIVLAAGATNAEQTAARELS